MIATSFDVRRLLGKLTSLEESRIERRKSLPNWDHAHRRLPDMMSPDVAMQLELVNGVSGHPVCRVILWTREWTWEYGSQRYNSPMSVLEIAEIDLQETDDVNGWIRAGLASLWDSDPNPIEVTCVIRRIDGESVWTPAWGGKDLWDNAIDLMWQRVKEEEEFLNS